MAKIAPSKIIFEPVSIDDLNWKLLPDGCNNLTMDENGVWSGNELTHKDIKPTHYNKWTSFADYGERWVNIEKLFGIRIKPVDNWRVMYIRPKVKGNKPRKITL